MLILLSQDLNFLIVCLSNNMFIMLVGLSDELELFS